jgi:hypothetical protein
VTERDDDGLKQPEQPREEGRQADSEAEQPRERADPSEGHAGGPRRRRRVREIDPRHLGTFRWLQGVLGQALAVVLTGEPVGEDRMDVGVAGDFLSRLDRLTRLLAAHFAGEQPKTRGTIARPAGVGRLQLAEASAGRSITLYFAVDQPTQLTLEGGTNLYDSPMGQAVSELVKLVRSSDDDDALIARSHQLGDRIADRYYELVDFLVNEQIEAQWLAVDRGGATLSADGAAEVRRYSIGRSLSMLRPGTSRVSCTRQTLGQTDFSFRPRAASGSKVNIRRSSQSSSAGRGTGRWSHGYEWSSIAAPVRSGPSRLTTCFST